MKQRDRGSDHRCPSHRHGASRRCCQFPVSHCPIQRHRCPSHWYGASRRCCNVPVSHHPIQRHRCPSHRHGASRRRCQVRASQHPIHRHLRPSQSLSKSKLSLFQSETRCQTLMSSPSQSLSQSVTVQVTVSIIPVSHCLSHRHCGSGGCCPSQSMFLSLSLLSQLQTWCQTPTVSSNSHRHRFSSHRHNLVLIFSKYSDRQYIPQSDAAERSVWARPKLVYCLYCVPFIQ